LGRGHLGGGKTVCRSSCAISSVDDGPRESHKKRRYSLGSRNARVRWQNRGLPPKVRAYGGRPSIDPVVFFKLQLVMFFEGIRSERLLMQHAADRLSVRWYLGYDLGEPLPDHSSLTRIRERYGVDVFRRFFEAIVEQCQQAGLVWGRELYIDGTQVNANADLDSLTPRFAVEARESIQAHLEALFFEGDSKPEQLEATAGSTDSPLPQDTSPVAICPAPPPLPVVLSEAE